MNKQLQAIFVWGIILFNGASVLRAGTGANETIGIWPGNSGSISVTSVNIDDRDLELIRSRIIADLLKPAINADEVKKLVASIRADGSWPGINYTDVSRTGFEHRIHLENMMILCRALKKPGSAFRNDDVAKRTLMSALDYWLKNDFRCDNWWWNEMGTPQHMINILLLMDPDLSEEQKKAGLKIANRANLEASGARPGGDLLPIAGMLGKQALFSRDTALLARVIGVMATEIKITTGRGIKPDLSFHHRVDNVISTLTYGTSFAASYAYWSVIIAGTRFKLPENAIRLLIDYYLDGISRSMVYGIYPDVGAENRDMTRKNALRREGTELPENLLRASDYRAKELEEIIKLRKGTVKPTASNNRFFWHSSYLVHQRPTFFTSVRMHSSRASNMEQPHNEEGLKMHHFGDGSSFISRHGTEYSNIFPVWDWQKIPGTTILQNRDVPPFQEVAKKGLSDFSGGVSDGRYGLAAIDLTSVHDPLRAKKAWFFFDQQYVCLGSDINTTSNLEVFTTLNQTLLNGQVIAGTGVKQSTLTKGQHHLSALNWILHDSVGYVFFKPTPAEISNRPASGNWRLISHQASATTETVTKDVFSLWINHGAKAQDASYGYMVVPNVTAASLNDYLKKSGIEVLVNTPALQVVYNKSLQMVQAVFYQPGELKAGSVTIKADHPCIMMLDKKGKVSVSDPTQKLKKLTLKIRKANEEEKVFDIELPAEGMAGSTVTVHHAGGVVL